MIPLTAMVFEFGVGVGQFSDPRAVLTEDKLEGRVLSVERYSTMLAHEVCVSAMVVIARAKASSKTQTAMKSVIMKARFKLRWNGIERHVGRRER